MSRVVKPAANKTPEEMQTIEALIVQFEERTKKWNLQISRVKGAENNLATNKTKLEKLEGDVKETRDALIENGATFADPVDNDANDAKATKGGSKRDHKTPSTFYVMGILNVLLGCFLTENPENMDFKTKFNDDLYKKVQDKHKSFIATILQRFWNTIPKGTSKVLTEAEAQYKLSETCEGDDSIMHAHKMLWSVLKHFSDGKLTKTLSQDDRAKFIDAVMPSLQALVNAMTFQLDMTEAPVTYLKKKDDDKNAVKVKTRVDAKFIRDHFKAQGFACVSKDDQTGAEVPITFDTIAAEEERKRLAAEEERLRQVEQERLCQVELERLRNIAEERQQELIRRVKKRKAEQMQERSTRRTGGGKGPLQGPGGKKTSGPRKA